MNMIGQAAAPIPTELWGLILGPYGALVIMTFLVWKLWGVISEDRKARRDDTERLIVALQTTATSNAEVRKVLEEVVDVLKEAQKG